MNRIEPGRKTPADHLPRSAQAQVAELSARILGLPERKMASRETTEMNVRPAIKPRRSLLRRGLWWTTYLSVWAVTLSLASVALLRIAFHDGTFFLCWINAFTRYVYLPAYVCLLWAAWQRRRLLSLVALAVVGCHVVWMAPNFLRDRRFDVAIDSPSTAANASQSVRVLFANVLGGNKEYESLWSEIAEADPDVFILAEFSSRCRKSLTASPLVANYLQHSRPSELPRDEVVVFSKLPIKSQTPIWFTSRIVQAVEVQIGSQTLTLIGLHAPRPMYPPEYDFYGYYQQLIPFLNTAPRPLVIIGDFNATEHSRVYKQLQATGLRSAHDDRGRGFATTWPNGHNWLPPIRIDQAFLSPEVECVRVWEGQFKGSDHKPLIVDVRIRGINIPDRPPAQADSRRLSRASQPFQQMGVQ